MTKERLLTPFWAKSGEPPHLLLLHMLDTAAVAKAILAREPSASLEWLAKHLGRRPDCARDWLVYWTGLHDLGKATSGFQRKWSAGKEKLEECSNLRCQSKYPKRHDIATGYLLRDGSKNLMARVLAAHHGRYLYGESSCFNDDGRPAQEPPGWDKERMGLQEAYDAVIAPPDIFPKDNSSAHWLWFAGLVSISDWIASNKDYFCHGWRGFSSSDDYFANASELAEKALEEIGWASRRKEWDTPKLRQWLSIVTGSQIAQSRPMQDVGEDLLQESGNEPALIIVEAPMGEGKTEFALRTHEHLHKHCGHRGLYFALPTQATANAMYDRVKDYVDKRFSDMETHVQLAHGGVKKTGIPWNAGEIHDENEKEGAAIAGMWFSQRRRAILSAFGVGTIDQALLACMPVKHHFVRLFGLGNRVVVLDEIHAYDAYTGTLIECLLEWLRDMRCSVILMSATLPEKCRNSYIRKWTKDDCFSSNPPRPYPSISFVTAKDGAKVREFETNEKNIRVEATGGSINDIFSWCKESLKGGGRGAVILNTVGRAQRLYKELKRSEVNAEILLYHARFPADERLQIERQVLQFCGRNGKINRPFLLVATQVAEQSLDADFDFMLSDLAPIDLLLQRAGRLHRHERPRPPAHQQAIFTIAGGGGDNPPDVTEWDRIYDRYYLLATWHLLKECDRTWAFPKDIDRLVQRLYGDEPISDSLAVDLENLLENLKDCKRFANKYCVYPTYDKNTILPPTFDENFILAKTRLSDLKSLRIVPIFVDGEKRYLRQNGDEELDEATPFSLYERTLSISHQKMIKMAEDCPPYWRKIQEKGPLLRDVWGVEFFRENGRMVRCEGIKISCKLGVDYSSVEDSGT